MAGILDYVIESPTWVKFLIWLAAVSADAGIENATLGTFSITKSISFLFSSIMGFVSGGNAIPEITATGLWVFTVAIGILTAVLWVAGSRK